MDLETILGALFVIWAVAGGLWASVKLADHMAAEPKSHLPGSVELARWKDNDRKVWKTVYWNAAIVSALAVAYAVVRD